MPWLFLSLAVILWGLAPVKAFLNGGPRGLAAYRANARPYVSRILSPAWEVPLLHRTIFRDFPVEATPVDRARIDDPSYRNTRAEAAAASAVSTLISIYVMAAWSRTPSNG